MNALDPAAAHAAKAANAARFEALAMTYVPAGYKVTYRKSLTGRCWYSPRWEIAAPRPVTRQALYIFLHECAHAIHHGPLTPAQRPPVYVMEFEAEQFAHRIMREHGIAVPRKQTQRAKAYVRRKMMKLRTTKPRADVLAWVNS